MQGKKGMTEKPYIIYCDACSSSIAMPVDECGNCHMRTNMTPTEVLQYKEFEDVSEAIERGIAHISHLDDPIKDKNTKLLVDIWIASAKNIMGCLDVQREDLGAYKAENKKKEKEAQA